MSVTRSIRGRRSSLHVAKKTIFLTESIYVQYTFLNDRLHFAIDLAVPFSLFAKCVCRSICTDDALCPRTRCRATLSLPLHYQFSPVTVNSLFGGNTDIPAHLTLRTVRIMDLVFRVRPAPSRANPQPRSQTGIHPRTSWTCGR
jgi:hypothetical protein